MLDRLPETSACRILVVGGCIFRGGVSAIIRGLAPGAEIDESACLHDARGRLKCKDFTAAVFDVDTEDCGPADFRLIRAQHPGTTLAVFSRADHASAILAYLAAGASGYAFAWSSQLEIERAIGAILRGAVYVPASFVAQQAKRRNDDTDAACPWRDRRQLTGRQNDVLHLVCGGRSNKQIARELNLSPHTVKIHVGALLRHFAVTKRSALAIAASGNLSDAPARQDPAAFHPAVGVHP